MKKKLYWNSCSFLDTEQMLSSNSPLSNIFYNIKDEETHLKSYKASIPGSSNELIFRKTLIDCSKNEFDFVIIAWSHPERALGLNLKESFQLDYNKLKLDSESQFIDQNNKGEIYCYENRVPHKAHNNQYITKFEPKGTDDTILYTISLHNFFKSKGIPHLFLNMGKLDDLVLEARYSWLQDIDSKNYLSENDSDDILNKMKFSFTKYYSEKSTKSIVKDAEIEDYKKLKGNSDSDYMKTGWIIDVGGHLGRFAFNDLFHKIHNHIIKNNLV